MNNKKIDIDSVFSRLREESKPTPLANLVEARESGALFALKQSVSTSLFSAKLLWVGMGTILAVSGGILYNAYTAHPVAPRTAAHPATATEVHDVSAPEHTMQAQADAAEEVARQPVVQPFSAAQMDKKAAMAPKTSGRSTAAHIGAMPATKSSNRKTSGMDTEQRDTEQIAASSHANGITTVNYLYHSDSKSMEMADMEPPSLLQPIEEFPLVQHTEDQQHRVSLTMNGLALMADIVQFQGELQLSDDLSGSLIFGVGNVAGQDDSSYSLLLAGAQLQYYVLGDFSQGLQVGTQFLFSSTDFRVKNTFLHENGRVLSIIPYAGYKLALESGLTLNLQAGVGAATPVYIPADQVGSGDNTEYKWHVSTRVQFNIGWSL